ncbi:hypothetical protein AGDE_16660 [Angomonas deanei]|uniref:C3H1-type domain-containing protein n=1 Tax=Angomonas deanei TaxID=59799 RepID=A0A7G2C3A1_9TRYP|nr:hypothetical protein AGDE_16660 [Angomonas deanei]CAD2213734.1 hypothetical protein, conserved [Angomonas deanei]|eukprot:EPY16670.1 hypothetical protein AGDE_16660 [Angomonas deanei]
MLATFPDQLEAGTPTCQALNSPSKTLSVGLSLPSGPQDSVEEFPYEAVSTVPSEVQVHLMDFSDEENENEEQQQRVSSTLTATARPFCPPMPVPCYPPPPQAYIPVVHYLPPPPPLYYYPQPMMMMMPPPPVMLPPPPPQPPQMVLTREITRYIGPSLKPVEERKSGRFLRDPEYYYQKVLEALPINDDPNYRNYAYEKYEPYQFRVTKCPHYKQGKPNSCRYGDNCFHYHIARYRRSVEVNLIGGLASVQDVFDWLRVKNSQRRE